MYCVQHGTAVSADEAVSENQLVLDLCNEGIQLDVDDAETCARLYHNRGIAKYCLGHLMGALFDCCMSVKTCPQAWQPYSLRGLLYEEIGEYKLAVKVGHPLNAYTFVGSVVQVVLLLLHVLHIAAAVTCYGEYIVDEWVWKTCL